MHSLTHALTHSVNNRQQTELTSMSICQ